MKDKEARRDARRVEAKGDKLVGGLSKEIKRVESKGDKARENLAERIASLDRILDGVVDSMGELDDNWNSKFIKREYWEERKEGDNPQ